MPDHPIALPAGQQELVVSPGSAFVVDGVQLAGPLATQLRTATSVPAQTGAWRADHRDVTVQPAEASRVLVVPESINPGWIASTGDGSVLNPVTVNGWQQGWVVPAGISGPITLRFSSNTLYRAGLIGGLALLPLLVLLALLPVRRQRPPDDAARPWRPGPAVAGVAVFSVGAVISGVAGIIVVGVAFGLRYLLRRREKLCDAVAIGVSSGGLILAGAVLSQNPWRSVDGYVGHAWGVQLLALASVAMVAASAATEFHPGDQEFPSGEGSRSSRPDRRSPKLRRQQAPPSASATADQHR